MLPEKARRSKRVKKLLLLIFILCILFLIASIILLPSIFRTKKPLFISPVTTQSRDDLQKLEKLFLNAQIAVLSITLDSNSYLVKLQDGGEIILSSKKDIEKQITSLQPILKQLTIEGRKFNRIDFRFDKPIIQISE